MADNVIDFNAVLAAQDQATNEQVAANMGLVKKSCGCKRRKRKGGLVLLAGSALVIGIGLGMLRK